MLYLPLPLFFYVELEQYLTPNEKNTTESGKLYTWGKGSSSQLGHGDLVDLHIPTLVETLATHTVTTVCCGWQHSIAATSCGEIYTWGKNRSGQLGLGDKETRPVPTLIPYSSFIQDATFPSSSPHVNHTEATTSVLSIADEESKEPSFVCTRVLAAFDFTAVLCSGVVYTWGGNNYGQLGLGDLQKRFSPCVVMNDVVSISCGWKHMLVLSSSSCVFAWGRCNFGQLGTGIKTKCSPTRVEIKVDSEGPVEVVACGSEHSSLVVDGKLYTWGWNEHGNLGDGTKENRLSPIHVPFPDSVTVSLLAVGGAAMIVRVD